MIYRKTIVILLFLALSGCAYTLDGLKIDRLSERSPAQCPNIEGWFTATAEIRASKGTHTIPATLPGLLLELGIMPHSSYRHFLKPELANTSIFLKSTPEGITWMAYDENGAEQSLYFAYDADGGRGGAFGTEAYCSQEKLVIRGRSATSNHGESFYYYYTDAVFRADENGLTVTVHDTTRFEGGLPIFPIWWTDEGEAELFFKRVH